MRRKREENTDNEDKLEEKMRRRGEKRALHRLELFQVNIYTMLCFSSRRVACLLKFKFRCFPVKFFK